MNVPFLAGRIKEHRAGFIKVGELLIRHEAEHVRIIHWNILLTDDNVRKIPELPLELLVDRGVVGVLHNARAQKQ